MNDELPTDCKLQLRALELRADSLLEEWRHATGETAERIMQQLDAVDNEHWALAIRMCEPSDDPALKRIGEVLKRLPE